jgi:hypothetical protein
MHNINALSVQTLFFPLNDAILFQGHGKPQAQDLQLGVFLCKVYHNVLLEAKSQLVFDHLPQLHMLDNTEEDKDMYWKYCKLFDYCKQKGDTNSSNQKCLVDCDDINKAKS